MGDRKMTYQNAFKSINTKNISNLRIVSMIPGDSQELLDDSFHASSPRYDSSEECRASYSSFLKELI